MSIPPSARREDKILVVSGLPRSGTSMMMKMLAAAGLELLVDGQRQADSHNPNGYYEYEPVKALKQGGGQWLEGARGRVVKVVSPLLPYLPAAYEYKVIFMQRSLAEVMSSQQEMLHGANQRPTPDQDRQVESAFQEHLAWLEAWMSRQSNLQVLYISYNQLLTQPDGVLPKLAGFIDQPLDAQAMLAVIDPALYRNRHR